MKYRDKIIQYFENCQDGVVVAANELYEKEFSKMSEAAFFKAIERLTKEGILKRISKGMYAYVKWDGQDVGKDEDILNHYFGDDNANGMFIGDRLYYKYGLISNVSKDIFLYSNLISKQTQNVGNIHVKKVNFQLSFDYQRIIEALEILANYDNIPDLNKSKFAKFARQFAKNYNDEAAVFVVNNMRYKKRTIAFMKKILDMYKVDNSLSSFLSYASDYRLPAIQRVAR